MFDYLLKNAALPGLERLLDVAVEGGKIVARDDKLDNKALYEIDLGGRLLMPGFVESHVHLDIALMNSWESPGRTEAYLSHYGLNDTLETRRKGFTSDDIEQRAGRALVLASRHGVTALRAQCHIDPEIGLKHLHALVRVKEQYAGLVTMQIVGFPQQGLVGNGPAIDLYRNAFSEGLDVMGCASNLDHKIDYQDHIDAALEMAMAFDVDLDAHVDLGLHQGLSFEELEVVYLARQVIEKGYQGRVTAGHVSALDSVLPSEAKEAISLIKKAEMSVVSQPDLYRLGRDDERHVRRGLTRVKEMLDAGVNVTYASNNVRDALRPLGNFDLLEEGLVLAYGAHMDMVEQLETIMNMSTYHAAKALRLPNYGLEVGCDADMVVFDAPSPSAALANQAEKRYVFKFGRLVAVNQVVSERFVP